MAKYFSVSRTIKFQPHELEAIQTCAQKIGIEFAAFTRTAAMRFVNHVNGNSESAVPAFITKLSQEAISHRENAARKQPRWESSY
jgi:hypothetical protein